MKLRYDDDNHAYWLDGKRCKSVTTVAKIPDDLYRLQLWERRQVAIGLASDPDLIEAVAAHVNDNDILNALCDQAKEKAGANRGSRRGTAAHRVTESHDAGHDIIPTALSTDILAGWTEVLDAAGLEVIPELIERIIIYPHEKICGKFDRICRTRKGRLVIVDLKSGARAIDYPHAAAVQLALYANAPVLAAPLDARGEAATFEEMPDVDKKWGVLIHLPEDGAARAVKLDIEAGWKAAQEICFPTLRWRRISREMLIVPLAEIPRPAPWQPPDEGVDLTQPDVDELRDRFKTCTNRAAVDAWLQQSVDAGRSFNVAGPGCRPTMRRRRIIEAAIVWAPHDEDVVWSALSLAIGGAVPALPLGAVLGSLSIDEAARLYFFGEQIAAGGMFLTFSEDGTPVLSDTSPNPAA